MLSMSSKPGLVSNPYLCLCRNCLYLFAILLAFSYLCSRNETGSINDKDIDGPLRTLSDGSAELAE